MYILIFRIVENTNHLKFLLIFNFLNTNIKLI